MKKVIWMLADL